jgi:hypothetical protein
MRLSAGGSGRVVAERGFELRGLRLELVALLLEGFELCLGGGDTAVELFDSYALVARALADRVRRLRAAGEVRGREMEAYRGSSRVAREGRALARAR